MSVPDNTPTLRRYSRHELLEKIRTCPTLPSLPTIAVQVLDLAQKNDVDIQQIARVITKDPALSTKILKTVNSSFYGRSKAVSSLSQALVILGLQSVKSLVLGFSLVSNLSTQKPKGFKHLLYWKRAIYAATAARAIAMKVEMVQQEEAFLCGLLMDIGMLVLDQVLGSGYGPLCDAAASHGDQAGIETNALGMAHAEIGGILAAQWRLPPLLCVPIAQHHDGGDSLKDATLKKLTQVVCVATRCADVFVDASPAEAIHGVRGALARTFGLTELDSDALLAEIGKLTKEAAGLFEINIGRTAEYDTILKRANEALVALSLDTQRKASQLAAQNHALKVQASTDSLTGLLNRAAFDAFMTNAFASAMAENKPLSLVILDLDDFKGVNDAHGHPVGDAVLRAVGKLLRAAARKADLPARYGGEEMALVLPNTSRSAASEVAELIRRALAARPITTSAGAIPITASLGVATAEPASGITTPEHLVKAADLALYHAKNNGRNTVRVFSPVTAKAA